MLNDFDKIELEKIINREFYRVWFFTNEKIGEFIKNNFQNENIKKVFAVAGSGDFAFNILSTNNIEELYLCDIRQQVLMVMDLKIALFKKYNLEEINKIFNINSKNNYKNILENLNINEKTKIFFNKIFENNNQENFIKLLKKTNHFFNYTFDNIKNKNKFFLYLDNENYYKNLLNNINKLEINLGDFYDNLKIYNDDYFNLIYTSNILDSKKYVEDNKKYLNEIKNKLNKNGFLFLVNQNKKNKIIKFIENNGFKLYKSEFKKLNLLNYIKESYVEYSFLIFRKI